MSNQVVSNTDAQTFMKSSALEPYCLPSGDSALIKKEPAWYYRITTGTIQVVKKNSLPQNIDFDIPIGKKSELFYGEIIRIMSDKYDRGVEDFNKAYGFDSEALPDSNYLLKCIYALDPESPFISVLPKKSTSKTALQERLDKELERALLDAVLNGKKLAAARLFDFSAIKEHLDRVGSIYLAYRTCTVDAKKLKKQAETVIRQAVLDPTIRAISERYNARQLLGDINSLSIETKIALEKLKKGPQTPALTAISTFPPK